MLESGSGALAQLSRAAALGAGWVLWSGQG